MLILCPLGVPNVSSSMPDVARRPLGLLGAAEEVMVRVMARNGVGKRERG